ncbi:MAG: polysaccharide deacetylase family protein [Lachnospira sp.]|nr:polysaccharide deacetylase family protein [Lachnospira sp.]
MAGKKALPIYCVDMESKQNSSADSSGENHISDTTDATNASTSEKKYISISFDAAWGAEDTVQILDILDKHNVKTTFFMTGGWVNDFPDMVKEIHSRGHDLGNHSQNHKHMSKLSVAEQQDEINKVTNSVRELTGYEMFLFRPPYGDYNSTLIETVYGCNYYPVQWSVDSLDWKDYGVEKLIKTVTKHKNLDNGAIILMHNGAKYTAAALENIITTLQAEGYTFVPLSELIIRDNFHMDANGMQIAD